MAMYAPERIGLSKRAAAKTDKERSMKMEYKLIKDCLKGFILTREPETVTDELIISFTGAPAFATAVFENEDGNSLYRLLKDDTCAIPADFLRGRVKVTVAVLNGKDNAPKYTCEGIYTKPVPSVGVIVCPDGLDIAQELISAHSETQELNKRLAELNKRFDTLDEKLVKLLDGYDFE